MPKDETGTLDAHKLRELAAWYREFAERAEPSVREARLRIAEQLERDADLLEGKRQQSPFLLAPASPHRQPRLSGQGWGMPYRRCVYGVRGAISISTCCRVGW